MSFYFSDFGVLLGHVSLAQIKLYSKDPLKKQKDVLKKIVRRNKHCELGKKLNLKDVHSIEDYQRIVPLSTYADYEPYVDRMLNNGEKRLMFNGFNFRYASSSGSVGKPKMLPKGANDLWKMQCIGFSVSVATAYHHMKDRGIRMSNQVGPLALNLSGHKLKDGKQCNGAGQIPLRFLRTLMPFFCTSPMSLLYPNLEDKLDTSYLHLRFCLENKKVSYLGSIVVTLLTTMFDYLEENWEMMCDDIEKGIINPNIDIPDNLRAKYAKKFKPNPERANELRAIFKEGFDEPVAPKIWPGLQWAYGMMGSNLSVYVEKLRKVIGPNVPIHNMGYAAAEGFFAAPTELDVNDYVLLPWCLFFEFLPIEDLEDSADDTVKPLLINELEVGKNYEMIVSNFSGLYRYNMNDIVEASAPLFGKTPRIHMVQKVNGIVTITGEKLYEGQFVNAVKEAETQTGLKLNYFAGYANLDESRYDWYFEFEDQSVSQEKAEEFGKRVDTIIKGLNMEYAAKRDSFRLKDSAIFRLEQKSFDKFKTEILEQTKQDASRFKPNVLSQKEPFHQVIAHYVIK